MKKLIVIVCLLLISTAAFAQTRKRNTTSRRGSQPSTTANAEAQRIATIRTEGATKIANQIKNLSQFLYLLGGVAKGIEDLDRAAKSGQGSPTVLQQNEKNKATLKASFGDFRAGLDQLEVYFRTTPELQNYYVKLVGSAQGAADAEALAGTGQYNQAGRTLLTVVSRLTDVLVAMR